MSIVLVRGGDATFDVDVMDDVAPGWNGLKVVARDGLHLNIPPGESVELRADDDAIAGTYTVSFVLSPAAPRGWRAYLDRANGASAASFSSEAPIEQSGSGSGADNTQKKYIITVESAGGATVRRSKTTYRVPYARMSSEVKRLTRSGARIVSIEETTTY